MKITDYLAIYAATLSTIVFVWNIVQSRPRISVDLVIGLEGEGKAIQAGAYVIVRNRSSHVVHVANISLLYQYKIVTLKDRIEHLAKFRRLPTTIGWVHSSLGLYSVESGCPVRLEARKAHKVFVPESVLTKVISKATDRSIMASVQDELWNNVYSPIFKWPIRKEAQPGVQADRP